MVDDLIHGQETALYGDKTYASQARKKPAEVDGNTWRINRKVKRGKKLNCAARSFNRKSNRTRARVEHALLKLLYAGILKASERWMHPVQNWNLTLSQLTIHFAGRLNEHLAL